MTRTPSTFMLALAAGVFGLCAGPAHAQPQLLAPKSEIGFTIKQMGVPVNGKFGKFDAKITFDPKKPEAGSVAFTIDLASAAIGDADTVAELAKPAWFDSKRVPAASFQSSGIKAAGPGRYDVAGKLTIKGQSRDVLVPVTLAQSGGTTTASGSFAIKRLEFKIGDGDWADPSLVANEVQVKFSLALSGIAPM